MALIAISTTSFGALDGEPLRRLKAAGHEVRGNARGRRLAASEVHEILSGAVGLIAGTEPLTAAILEEHSRLRVISRCGAGLDNVDLDAATRLGIEVRAATGAHAAAVAELVLAGILVLLRSVATADRAVRDGLWQKPMGALLRGKTLGLVGLGRTGREVARLAAAFGAEIRAHDPVRDTDFAASTGVHYAPLGELLASSDIVSLHVPYSDELHHMFDADRLDSMKEGAYLVNAARGGLVDEEALAERLRSGRLAAAYLDVFECEPYSGSLTGLDNVLLTPHIGSYAAEARLAMELEAVDNLLEALA